MNSGHVELPGIDENDMDKIRESLHVSLISLPKETALLCCALDEELATSGWVRSKRATARKSLFAPSINSCKRLNMLSARRGTCVHLSTTYERTPCDLYSLNNVAHGSFLGGT